MQKADSTSSEMPGKKMRTRWMASAGLPGKSGRDGVEEPRRRQHAEEREASRHQRQQPSDGAGHLARLLPFSLGAQRRVDGNERGREDAFAEQVLQEVGDAQRRRIGVGGGRGPQVMAEDPLPHQPREPAEQDARADQQRGSGGARSFRRSSRSRRHALLPALLAIGHDARRIPSPGAARAPFLATLKKGSGGQGRAQGASNLRVTSRRAAQSGEA